MIYIAYSVFCRTFNENKRTNFADVALLIALTFLIYIALMAMIWYILGYMFPDKPRLRVMGFFGGTLKTVRNANQPLPEMSYILQVVS